MAKTSVKTKAGKMKATLAVGRPMKVVSLIKKLRDSGKSREEIASLLRVSAQSIWRWENGSSKPSPGNLSRLAELVK